MRKINHAIRFRFSICPKAHDAHSTAVAIGKLDFFQNFQVAARRILPKNSGAFNQFQKNFARAVENRDFDIIEIYKTIVHARAAQSREQMLAGW